MNAQEPPSWLPTKPVRRGGSSWRDSRLAISERGARVRASASSWAIVAIVTLTVVGIAGWMAREKELTTQLVEVGIPGLVGFGISLLALPWRRPRIDFERGVVEHGSERCPLSQVVGVQVLAEQVVISESAVVSWELNLVLKLPQLERINLLDHASRAHIVADAQRLAARLNVPLWAPARALADPRAAT